MSDRGLTSAMNAALEQAVIRPVLIVRLDIKDDPLTAWTGPGIFAPTGSDDPALNGQTFTGFGAPEQVGEITEDQGQGEPLRITARADADSEPLLRQIVADRRAWRGRRAWVWVGLLDQDEFTVVADPARIKTGYMTAMKVTRNESEATISVTVDNDESNAEGAPLLLLDHSRFYADDQFSLFLPLLANKPDGLERADIQQVRRATSPQPGRPIFPPGPYYGA